MPRLDPVKRRGFVERIARWALRRRMGGVPEGIGVLGHNPKILAAYLAYGALFESSHELPLKTRKLVHLRVAMRVGCHA